MSTPNIWKAGELSPSLDPQRGNGKAVKIIWGVSPSHWTPILSMWKHMAGCIGIFLHFGTASCLENIPGRWKIGVRILRAMGASDSDLQLGRWIFHWRRCPDKLWPPFLRCLLFLMDCRRILYPIILQCLDGFLKGLLFLSQKRHFSVFYALRKIE